MEIKSQVIKLLIFLVLGSVHVFVFAQSTSEATTPTFDAKKIPNARSESIELHDFRSGNMGFEIPLGKYVDSWSGIELPLSFSFNKTSNIPGGNILLVQIPPYGSYNAATVGFGAGQWQLELPRLEGSYHEQMICGRQSGFAPTLFLPGQPAIRFVENNPTTSPFPYAKYISIDLKWTITCLDGYPLKSRVNFDVGNNYNFLVQSSSGEMYEFKRTRERYQDDPLRTVISNFPHYAANYFNGAQAGFAFYASRISKTSSPYSMIFNYGDLGSGGLPDPGRVQIGGSSSYDAVVPFGSNNIDIESETIVNPAWAETLDFRPIRRIKSINIAGKIWEFEYLSCNYDLSNCLANDFSSGANVSLEGGVRLKYILKKLKRPDGKFWEFEYSLYRGVDLRLDGAFSRPGSALQISKITSPEGLVSTFTYESINTDYIYGQRPVYGNSVDPTYLALKSKSYSGTGLDETINFQYRYHVKNYDSSTKYSAETESYSFEFGPSKMKAGRFRRSPKAGYLGSPEDLSTFDMGRLIESATFPLPPAGTTIVPEPPAPLPATAPPPAFSIFNNQMNYGLGVPFTIDFNSVSTLPVIFASCKIDNGAYAPCTTLNSFTVPGGLSAGLHTISIYLTGASGNSSPVQTVSFYVGGIPDPNAPVITNDLADQIFIPGATITLSARFSGRVTKYEWYKNNDILVGANSSNLTIASAGSDANGTYFIRAYNGNSKKDSSVARVSLNPAVLMPILNLVLDE